jgi:four helix bundle protein
MTESDLKDRTKSFAVRVLKLADALPGSVSGKALANQISRSGTSVAANYRAACRAKSTADFISKLGIVEEEADETLFWLELAVEANLIPAKKLKPLMREAEELLKITVASIKTTRKKQPIPKSALRNSK